MPRPLPRSFYLRPDVTVIARELLGKVLVTGFDGLRTSGIITETEAYAGVDDRASHAYGGRRTERTEVMYARGGTAYVYLGVMALLDEYGLSPRLMSGTSMGAILSLFRSRMRRFEQDEVVNIVRTLSWRRLFRVVSAENRYGVPAALRLFLRSGCSTSKAASWYRSL